MRGFDEGCEHDTSTCNDDDGGSRMFCMPVGAVTNLTFNVGRACMSNKTEQAVVEPFIRFYDNNITVFALSKLSYRESHR
mmetsp:Transcript_24648/g.58506  ORF Transcript_24648/g.58506 Transcript_24648/m.58506 type:complete len:80 (-) Transcript_24648:65-304(-)